MTERQQSWISPVQNNDQSTFGCLLHKISKSYSIPSQPAGNARRGPAGRPGQNITRIQALDNISLFVPRGYIACILGPSGCGKTTLLKVIAGLSPQDSGSIQMPGIQGSTGIVFQEPRLLAAKSVRENMKLAFLSKSKQKTKSDQEHLLQDIIQLMGLQDFQHAKPHQLSGGMAQRTALGRTLCRQPELLLMDEPFGALDAITRYKLQDELINIQRKQKLTIIFVTHDVQEAAYLGDTILIMKSGSIHTAIPVPHEHPRQRGSQELAQIEKITLEKLQKT